MIYDHNALSYPKAVKNLYEMADDLKIEGVEPPDSFEVENAGQVLLKTMHKILVDARNNEALETEYLRMLKHVVENPGEYGVDSEVDAVCAAACHIMMKPFLQ